MSDEAKKPGSPDQPSPQVQPHHLSAQKLAGGAQPIWQEDPDNENAKHGKRLSFELYEAMWQAYRDGRRSKSSLQRQFNVGYETASRVVDLGYPDRGWLALKDRAAQWDEAKIIASQQASVEQAKQALSDYQQARTDNLNLIKASKAAIAKLVRKALNSVESASFTKVRRRKNKNGDYVDVDMPPSAFEMADALRTIAQAVKDLGAHESFWLGGPTERSEVNVSGVQQGWLSLSEEQLEYIVNSGGELPPGVSEEQLFGKVDPKTAN